MTTVRPRPALDPDPCVRVALPLVLDERAAAWLELPPDRRCVHLSSSAGTSWDSRALMVLAHRVAGRPPVVLDDLAPDLADALAVSVLTVLDWVTAA